MDSENPFTDGTTTTTTITITKAAERRGEVEI